MYVPWFALKNIPGIGNSTFKKLIARFKTPENVFNSDYSELIKVKGIRKESVNAVLKGMECKDSYLREIEIARKNNIKIVTYNCEDYPELLKEIHDPPPFLYVKGNLNNRDRKIAVVGSRNASSYGLFASEKISKELSLAGFNIVSGMARGIDTKAHIGALKGGKTTAVLGSGLLRIYPAENRKLFDSIVENGAVISEFNLNEEPLPRNFPVRNRIISGSSIGTVVVEAAMKSGSLITARMAVEQNREVFAVPGNIMSFKSSGTHSLIKDGAKLVENINDITEEFSLNIVASENIKKEEKIYDLEKEELNIYNLLDIYPIHIDEIIRKTSMEPGRIASVLFKLELSGYIKQETKNYFSISEDQSV